MHKTTTQPHTPQLLQMKTVFTHYKHKQTWVRTVFLLNRDSMKSLRNLRLSIHSYRFIHAFFKTQHTLQVLSSELVPFTYLQVSDIETGMGSDSFCQTGKSWMMGWLLFYTVWNKTWRWKRERFGVWGLFAGGCTSPWGVCPATGLSFTRGPWKINHKSSSVFNRLTKEDAWVECLSTHTQNEGCVR